MNLASLKKIYDKLPYAVKAPFAKRLRNQLLNNPDFKETYECLLMSDSIPGLEWSEEHFHEVQERLLSETLSHAYFHTKYYRELFDSLGLPADFTHPFETLKKLPLLTKETLREHLQDIIADDGEGFEVTTGGTSGTPTTLMMSNEAHYREWAFVYHYWSKFGYNPKTSHLATFRGFRIGNRYSIINPMYNEIRMNIYKMNRDTIINYVRAIKKYNVDFLYGYPSAIYTFCKLAQEEGILLSGYFKGVFLISENLLPYQKEKIEEVLRCPIAIFYGHTERAVFAGKFEEGYLPNCLYGVTEISNCGEPIVTGFINKKTPLIRYVVDDSIFPLENGYYEIEGHRKGDVLVGLNGEEISSAATIFHDKTFEHVLTYQFHQKEVGKCDLWIVPNKQFKNEEMNAIKNSVESKFGNSIECNVVVVDNIELTERGKYKTIVKDP